MLPSAVNDTMRDMMAQIRDCGDGIRDGTYTMTAPKITGGTITGVTYTNIVITGGSITGITDLAVADGGTGASSFTSGALLKGAGTSAITTATAGTDYAGIDTAQTFTKGQRGEITTLPVSLVQSLSYKMLQEAEHWLMVTSTTLSVAQHLHYRQQLTQLIE
jgi:hypothetical protein